MTSPSSARRLPADAPVPRKAGRDEIIRYWPVILAAFVGIMTGVWALPLFLIGPMSRPLELAMGWSRADVAAGVAYFAAGTTLATPLIGILADRMSRRLLAVVSMVVMAACIAAIAFVTADRLWQFHLLCFLMCFLGAGSGGMIHTHVIGSCFRSARGLALGIALSGTGAAAFATPLAAQWLLDRYDWRITLFVFAGSIAFVALPIVFFGFGRAPSRRAGATTPHTVTASPATAPRVAPVVTQQGATPAQALSDARFYLLLLAVVLFGIFISGLIINLVPMLIDRGLSAAKAAQVASLLGITIIIGRLGVGSLLDRLAPARVGAVVFLLGAAGALLFVAGGAGLAFVTILAIGLLLGAEVDLLSFLALRYFGNRHYGAIYGLLFTGYSGCAMISPLLAATLIGRGGYDLLFAAAGIGFLLAGGLMLALRDRAGDGGDRRPG